LASHDVKLVLALQLGGVGGVLSGTDTETVLVERDLRVSTCSKVSREALTKLIHCMYQTSLPSTFEVALPPTGLPRFSAPHGSSSPPESP
jgi:hypothetical protein